MLGGKAYTHYLIVLSIFLSSFIFLSACIKTVDQRGYTLDLEALDTLKVGKSRRHDVISALGSPSSYSNLGQETWFYISNTSEYIAFMDPKIKKQRVDAITFDKDGLVTSMRVYTEADFKNIKISNDSTPTVGNELGLAEQLLGNIGRFEGSGGGRSASPKGPSQW